VLLKFISLFSDATWEDAAIEVIHDIEHHVLQVPFFLMSIMRYISPAMDQWALTFL
jgi:hypothetical protein